MIDTDKVWEFVQDNLLAFLVGYTLATGELHLIIADVMGLTQCPRELLLFQFHNIKLLNISMINGVCMFKPLLFIREVVLQLELILIILLLLSRFTFAKGLVHLWLLPQPAPLLLDPVVSGRLLRRRVRSGHLEMRSTVGVTVQKVIIGPLNIRNVFVRTSRSVNVTKWSHVYSFS